MNPSESLMELFRSDLETQLKSLTQGLIDLEKKPDDANLLESLMRAAHSIKGAARVISLMPVVRLSHAMEDCFVAAQKGQIEIHEKEVDLLLRAVDVFKGLTKVRKDELEVWVNQISPSIDSLIEDLSSILKKTVPGENREVLKSNLNENQPVISKPFQASSSQDKVLRITAEHLNRLMGLAGESLVEARWLSPFGENMQNFKAGFKQIGHTLDLLRDNLRGESLNEAVQVNVMDLQEQLQTIYNQFKKNLGELTHFIGRYSTLSDRLYQEVVDSRMRPFADGVEGFPRMVRDLGRQLGKQVRLEIIGQSTKVDRDILEKLESPLTHLLRNAVDHGIESPEERLAAGKPAEGIITLEARHQGGMLAITVSDDGRGVDIEQLRRLIVEKKYLTQELADRLTNAEVIDFLFLPGFSTSSDLSDISGRGVGLNIVQSFVQEIGGHVITSYVPKKGTTFNLRLPLTLSVIRALLVEISGEVYALPLARIDQSFLVAPEEIGTIENRQIFHRNNQAIPLIFAWQILELEDPALKLNPLPVIIVSDRSNCYGLAVESFIGEKELVLQELDARLGKVPDILASSILEDGSPILILDVEDVVHSIENLLSGKHLTQSAHLKQKGGQEIIQKRILVVEDSITVRELEARLLKNQGFDVETAVNGVDGLNALKLADYDLVITDVDMPRMGGIELVKEIRKEPKLHSASRDHRFL